MPSTSAIILTAIIVKSLNATLHLNVLLTKLLFIHL